MSALTVNLHGPVTATSHTQIGSYGTIGIVKVSSVGAGVDLTIFAPTPEAAALIAHSINAAWPVAVSKSEAA